MSTRNDFTYKPLIYAGYIVILVRIIMAILGGLVSIILYFDSSLFLTINTIYTYGSIAIGFITNMLFLIFILITFQRIDRNPEHFSGNRDKIKLGIISSLILIIFLTVFAVLFFIFGVLYYMFGIIALSETAANIILFIMLGFVVLGGIFYIPVFIILGNMLASDKKLHDLRLFVKYSRAYGILMGVYYIILPISFVTMVIIPSNPVLLIVLEIFSSSIVIFTSITSICEIIMAAGFITIGRKLR
jgi:hypothetical protein